METRAIGIMFGFHN